MQIVIPLSSESHNDYVELRYALRSFQKYLSGVTDVYLIGGKPEWIKEVIHIPCGDIPDLRHKEANICNKIKIACATESIEDEFLFANDDQFLLKNFPAASFPYHFHDTLYNTQRSRWVKDPYLYSLVFTQKYLLGLNLPVIDFDGHSPLIYNKALFMKLVGSLNWQRAYGFCIKSLYCNQLQITGTKCPDVKIRRQIAKPEILSQIDGLSYFSTDERAINDPMINVLNGLFPKKSKYE